MNITDIAPNIRMIELENPGQAYLVRSDENVILIDSGTAGQADSIEEALNGWGLDRASLTYVLLTHWHPDHVGSAAALRTWPNVKIWASAPDAPIVAGDEQGSFPTLTPAEEGFYTQMVGGVPEAEPVPVDRELRTDERLDELSARVISTPGHTAGSVAYYFPHLKALFTGDVATNQQGQVMLGPFDVDRAQARESFQLLRGLDLNVVCFGHGAPLIGAETASFQEAVAAETVPDPLG